MRKTTSLPVCLPSFNISLAKARVFHIFIFTESHCEPYYSNPSNGEATCSDRNLFDSVCLFKCVEGFVLEGPHESRCTSTGWSATLSPYCSSKSNIWSFKNFEWLILEIECDLDDIDEEDDNRIKHCSKDTDLNSVCTFTCVPGYQLVGTSRRCMPTGKWNTSLPFCASKFLE